MVNKRSKYEFPTPDNYVIVVSNGLLLVAVCMAIEEDRQQEDCILKLPRSECLLEMSPIFFSHMDNI